MRKAHCILGGTFTYVHGGHLRMLEAASKFRRITIGLTSDAYVRAHKIYPAFPYQKRLSKLKAALERAGMLSRTAIHCIGGEAGGADTHNGADTIIVSDETLGAAQRINKARKRRGLKQLKIISVPLLYGQDLKKISCEAIFGGKTDLKEVIEKNYKIEGDLRRQVMTLSSGLAPPKTNRAFFIFIFCIDASSC
jgi:pantetheine-phosphate adenylyltransferase